MKKWRSLEERKKALELYYNRLPAKLKIWYNRRMKYEKIKNYGTKNLEE